MSSALAIAGVTWVLSDLLNEGIVNGSVLGNVKVTAIPPLRDPKVGSGDTSQLNLFLYQVTPNQGWRNQGLPAFGSAGTRTSNPPLAIDLHYLVTVYDERDLHGEVLLGYAMQLLHENPVLPRKAIRQSLVSDLPADAAEPKLPQDLLALSQSGLADQIESIRITPQYLTTEEMSKLWTSFMAPYRPSMAYLVTVVLIESERPVRPTLPVRERAVYAVAFQQPLVSAVEAASGPGDLILPGGTLLIRGERLRGPATTVLIDGLPFTPQAADMSDTRISLSVPADMRAGVHALQVAHSLDLGEPPVPHCAVESNVVPFLLHPAITGSIADDDTLAVAFQPKVDKAQRVKLLLGEVDPPPDRPGRSYSLDAPVGNGITAEGQPDTGSITFSLADVEPGSYLIRVQVDGAASALATDTAKDSPTFKQFVGPKVTIK
jgi:hypothetical protein